MGTLSQSEWLKMLDAEGNGSGHKVVRVRVNGDGEVLSVLLDANPCSGIRVWDKPLTAEEAAFAGGEKRAFSVDGDGSVSLLVDCAETPKYPFPDRTASFAKPKTVPFARWSADYIGVLRHTKRERCREGCRAVCAEVDPHGMVVGIVVEKRDEKMGYDRLTLVNPTDLLTFTYGLVRKDICEAWGYEPRHGTLTATFNSAYDLVFDADETKFRYNDSYHGGYFEAKRAKEEAEAKRAARIAAKREREKVA